MAVSPNLNDETDTIAVVHLDLCSSLGCGMLKSPRLFRIPKIVLVPFGISVGWRRRVHVGVCYIWWTYGSTVWTLEPLGTDPNRNAGDWTDIMTCLPW